MDVFDIDNIWKTNRYGFVGRYEVVATEQYLGRIDLHFRNYLEVGRIQITEKPEVQQLFKYL